MLFRQGTGIFGGQAVQHYALTHGLEDDARFRSLDPAHFHAQLRAVVEEAEQFLIHRVDFLADGGQPL